MVFHAQPTLQYFLLYLFMNLFMCISGFAIIKMALGNLLKASVEVTWVCQFATVDIINVC